MLLSEHNVHYELQGLRTYFGWIITAIRNSNGNSLSVEPHGYIFAHNGIWSSNLEKMFHFTPWELETVEDLSIYRKTMYQT